MTENEALRLSVLAQRLMPASPEGQAGLLMKAILAFDMADAQGAIETHAMTSRFIDVPAIREGLSARKRGFTRREAIDRGIETRQAERARWGHELEREREIALAFCQSQTPEDLERMRLGVLGSVSTVAAESWRRAWAGKPTLACDMLVRLIHKTYGAAGVGEAVSA